MPNLIEASYDDQRSLITSEVSDLEPLDLQFGIAMPETLPKPLYAPCFGDLPVTEAEAALGLAGASSRLFALLDASAIPNLPERLAQSGLEHRCLFQNSEDLEELVPWLVELPEGNPFTRNLFTHDPKTPAPWHLWNHQAGFYIRARLDLGDLWQHMRKSTKLADRRGKWYLVRFWETSIFWTTLDRNDPLIVELLTGLSSAIVLRDGRARIGVAPNAANPRPKTLTEETRRRLMLIWNAQKIGTFLRDTLPYQTRACRAGSAETEDFAALVLDWCQGLGFHSLRDVQRFAIIHCFLGFGFDRDLALPEDLRTQAIRDRIGRDEDPAEAFAKHVRAFHAERLDLGERCRKTAGQLHPGTRYHQIYTGLLRQDGAASATKSLVTQLNRDILGANFAANPLVRNCHLVPPETGEVAEIYAALIAQIETQAERFDDRNWLRCGANGHRWRAKRRCRGNPRRMLWAM